jgi:hypothetical protein
MTPLSVFQRYGLAVISVLLALGGRYSSSDFMFAKWRFGSFLFALPVTAWYGGADAAVLALRTRRFRRVHLPSRVAFGTDVELRVPGCESLAVFSYG